MTNLFQRKLISTAFGLAPTLMLVSDLLALLEMDQYFWLASISFWLSFYFFLMVIYGMVQLAENSSFARLSAWVAVFGALIGITIIGMSRFAWGMEMQGVSEEMIRSAHGNPFIFFSSRFPGITFPLGLILLSIALKKKDVINGLMLVGLTLSIVLFPAGRIPQQVILNVIGDGLMVVFFGMLGRMYWKRREAE